METADLEESYNDVVSAMAMVVDGRSRKEYEERHVNTAINIDSALLLLGGDDANGIERATKGDAKSIRRWRQGAERVLYYDEESKDGSGLEQKLVTFLMNRSGGSKRRPNETAILRGGIKAWVAKFPFLCSATQPVFRMIPGTISMTEVTGETGGPAPSATSSTPLPPPPPPPLPKKGVSMAKKPGKKETEEEEEEREEQERGTAKFPSMMEPDFLFLGGEDSARSEHVLRSLEISHVVNMCAEIAVGTKEESFGAGGKRKKRKEVERLHCPCEDVATESIMPHLHRACEFIESARAQGGRVLVHCAMGISRSPTVVIAWLMKSRGWSVQQAIGHVKHRRPQIKPNAGFIGQLEEFGKIVSRK